MGVPDTLGWAGEMGSLPAGGECCGGSLCCQVWSCGRSVACLGSGDAEKEIDWIVYEILQVQMLDPSQMY